MLRRRKLLTKQVCSATMDDSTSHLLSKFYSVAEAPWIRILDAYGVFGQINSLHYPDLQGKVNPIQ
jgi:hypothetical protein